MAYQFPTAPFVVRDADGGDLHAEFSNPWFGRSAVSMNVCPHGSRLIPGACFWQNLVYGMLYWNSNRMELARSMQITHQKPLADQVYEVLLTAICKGEYAPGDRLSQDRIAQSLNVSRQPVLQAFALLKAEGHLCDVGRRGLKVTPFDADFMLELYELRGAIDRMTAHRAALCCTTAQGTEGQVILERGATARESGSLVDFTAADMAFHQWIYQVAGNRAAIKTMSQYWNHLRRMMSTIQSLDKEFDRVWSEHAAIHAAIATGDAVLAERLALAHVNVSSAWLRHNLPGRLSGTSGATSSGQ